MLKTVADRWWVMLVRGICVILIGLGAIVWPQVTLFVAILFFGVFTMADGVTAFVLGINGKPDGRVWWEMIALGILAIVAGLGALVWPDLTLAVFIIYAAVSAIVHGVLEIIAAIKLRKVIDGEWLLALSGLFSIGFGILLFVYPIAAAEAFAIVIGIYMLFFGAMAVALALRLKSLKSKRPASA